MRRASLALMAAAAIHSIALTSPALAQSQVQPVPYGTAQPVPYNPAPAPTPPPLPAPTTTPPPGAANDVIHLKNGGLLRGTIVDVIPGSHARIQLPTGEIAMVQWSEIARIENAGPKPATPPATTVWKPPPAAPAGPPALTGPKLLVHLESSRSVRLARLEPTRGTWDSMCDSPCDKQVPVEGDYRIEGTGIRPSKQFSLQGKAGDRVVIDVNAASKGWFAAGIVGTGVGVLTVVIGLYIVAVGAIGKSLDTSFCSGTATTGCGTKSETSSDSVKAAGWTVFGVGAVATGLGVIALASNWRSSVSQEVEVPVDKASPAARSDAFRREATWRHDDLVRAMPKQDVYVPFITQSF